MFAEEATQEHSPLMPNKKFSFEAERILNVLGTCISQVEIAAALPNILQFYSASGVADEELSKVLHAHQALEERLKKLQCQEPKSDGLQEKEAEEEKNREMIRLRESMKNSVRDVLRLFRVHPDVFWGLGEEINMEVGENEHMLIRMLQMFRSYVEKRLGSKGDLLVPQRKQPVFFDKTLEEQKLEEDDSAAMLDELDEMILQKDREIKNLERYLKEHEMQAEEESSVQDQHEKLQLIKLGDELNSLKENIDQMNIQLSKLMLENREAERILQERNDSLKIRTENILQSFDKDMQEIQAKLELSEKSYENELEEVRKLEGPFSDLQEQYNKIQEKRCLAEEKRKEEMRQLELKTKASIIIQAWWRGYNVRKALKSKAKKTKKAKKSKGKAKKTK